uniref:Uncharacterized protein n=1 Tax=Rhizophora mucronata TaxID=61149 RepID=A0A2P2M1H9_RHIMU
MSTLSAAGISHELSSIDLQITSVPRRQ